MSIRLVQIFWNLVGGIFVLRGGYHAPTEKEQESVESDDADADDDERHPLEETSSPAAVAPEP